MRTLVIGLSFMLAACEGGFGNSNTPKMVKSDDVKVMSRPADVHAILFKNIRTDFEKVCMSPPPDSAATYDEGVSLQLPGAVGGEGIAEGAGKGALGLGGRSPSTLITREVLYRTCELMMNMNASPEKMEEVFFKVLAVLVKINAGQTEDGSAALGAQPGTPIQPPVIETDGDLDDDDDLDPDDSDGDSIGSGGQSSSNNLDSWPVKSLW